MINNNDTGTKKRLEYLDMARGVSVMLVALGHIYKNRSNLVRIWLYSFHIPIFFIISGYLAKHSDYDKYSIKELIKKKFRTLIIPYVSFSVISAIFYIFFSYIKGEDVLWTTKDMFYRIVTFRGLCATWFLFCLFGCEILFFILKKTIKNKYVFNIVLIALFVFSLLGLFPEDNIMCIPLRIFTALGFYALGYYGYNIKIKIKRENIFIFCLLAVNIIMTIYNGHVELYLLIYNNPFIYVINSVVGSMFIILLCKKLKVNRIINYFGKNSIVILVTHFILVSALIEFYAKIIGSFNEYVDGLIILVVAMIIEAGLIKIINKYLYMLLGKKIGLTKN